VGMVSKTMIKSLCPRKQLANSMNYYYLYFYLFIYFLLFIIYLKNTKIIFNFLKLNKLNLM